MLTMGTDFFLAFGKYSNTHETVTVYLLPHSCVCGGGGGGVRAGGAVRGHQGGAAQRAPGLPQPRRRGLAQNRGPVLPGKAASQLELETNLLEV